MEMGADGVLMNTAIAAAANPILMAEAMQHAVLAGRQAYLAGRMPRKALRHRQLSTGRGLKTRRLTFAVYPAFHCAFAPALR